MTENKSSKWPKWVLNPEPSDYGSDALTTRPAENYRDQNLPFRKSQPEKRLPKFIGDLFRVKIS